MVLFLGLLGLALLSPLVSGQTPAEVKTVPRFTPEDVAKGERLFVAQCASCHGPEGHGERGPSLRQPRLRRATNDHELFEVIDNGISGTEMPRTPMSDGEIWRIVAYIKSLQQRDPEPVAGDAARGRRIFREKGACLQCHTAEQQGGRLGPELNDIGARRSAKYLREALTDPEAALPDDFLQVRVKTRDGRQVVGARLNEDTFSIQIRDAGGEMHSFWKKDLVELVKERGKSPMPSYRGLLTEAETDDLVAYLASLRESP